jgi:hypothetical protein
VTKNVAKKRAGTLVIAGMTNPPEKFQRKACDTSEAGRFGTTLQSGMSDRPVIYRFGFEKFSPTGLPAGNEALQVPYLRCGLDWGAGVDGGRASLSFKPDARARESG